MVFRVYVEKKPSFNIAEQQLADELRNILGIEGISAIRMFNRYDVEGLAEEVFAKSIPTVFSEPQVDEVYAELPAMDARLFATQYLPGQFDQRADSASECIQLMTQGQRPTVRTAMVYAVFGDVSDEDMRAIRNYLINPVESREASLDKVSTLAMQAPAPKPIEVLHGFCEFDDAGLQQLIDKRELAMDLADAKVCQDYFRSEHRDPTITEIRVIDTYWSDHCRHTTFNTQLERIRIDDDTVKRAFDRYLAMREELQRTHKPISLMDMATLGAKYLKKQGVMTQVDESDEINACTVKIQVAVNGELEDWLFLFKNETHNHPTEIEPFGGAATCIGGCIRDPLSGRSYVYQAMRVTGAGDPREPIANTLQGKLPQRKIVTTAAAGYSSYGNQIGLATGQVHEIYHPGYVAKRMEVGAVVGATPADHVRRETPTPGDAIILLGGRTGRDGIGGATGASKSQNVDSVEESGAEVQKGNAPIERKLQRLFRKKEACRLIKRCNDFGAGGVSVAVGEIADGLLVDLNAVPKKYEGLDGTELAISESQERMAVDVDAADVEQFMAYAREENLEASVIATVTDDARMRMTWNGETIVDLSRTFLASNGASKHQDVVVSPEQAYEPPFMQGTLAQRFEAMLRDINIASQKGLIERFDSTVGAASVLMPLGGTRQLTPAQAMVAKLPVDGVTHTASAMAWGFNPYLTQRNQFTGSYLAVVESVAKLIATGFTREQAYLSLQEYFGKLHEQPERWGKPMAALLGALMAQLDLQVGAIGGKDSMSGSFEHLDVPDTLISFAVSVGDARDVVSPEFKRAGSMIVRVAPRLQADGLTPEPDALMNAMTLVERLTAQHEALAIATPGYGASAAALFTMMLGNRLGVQLNHAMSLDALFTPAYGSFLIELPAGAALPQALDGVSVECIGETTERYAFAMPAASSTVDDASTSPSEQPNTLNTLDGDELQAIWENGSEAIFPYRDAQPQPSVKPISYAGKRIAFYHGEHAAKPRVIIPVFAGTNCEYDTAHAFERAGAQAQTLVIRNLTPEAVADSALQLEDAIRHSQIIALPGGFSGGDEPDGSAKFITAFFRAPRISDAVRDLLGNRDGLMLGICNGFQALIKLGLVPYGDIVPASADAPTLTFNIIGRHQSRLVHTRVSSTLSPWFSAMQVGDVHTIAVSHGEGRFVASNDTLQSLIAHGQVATQYVDAQGQPSMSLDVNPNGSLDAIEAITSPDGRVLGKMGHTERFTNDTFQNVPGNKYQPIFASGVAYFHD